MNRSPFSTYPVLALLGLAAGASFFLPEAHGVTPALNCNEIFATLQRRSRAATEAVPRDPAERHRYFHEFYPQAIQDPRTGKIVIDLRQLRDELLVELQNKGIHPDEMIIELDGGAIHRGKDIPLPFSALAGKEPRTSIDGGSVNFPHYVRVLFKEKGVEVHVTDNALLEKEGFPKVDPAAFNSHPEPEMSLPGDLTRARGMNMNLVRASATIQHRNLVWNVNPSPNFRKLQEAYELYGPKLQPRPGFNSEGRITGWTVELPPKSGNIETFPADAIRTRGGAAFSQHSFFWDDHFVAEALVNTDPETALNTLVFWLDHQLPDGGFARELDFKGTPYHRAVNVKFGKSATNREYFNPLLAGWAWDELYRWNPQKVAPYLERVVSAMEKQQKWLLRTDRDIAMRDEKGKLLGFRWTNLGKGEDNAPTALDEFGTASLPKYGDQTVVAPGRERAGLSVALLCQYKMQYDYQAQFLRAMGRFSEAEEALRKAAEVRTLLRKDYLNANGWFVNRIPTGANGWAQEKVETLEGMWAVAAGVATPAEIRRMLTGFIQNPKKFGGPFLPAVPRDNPYYVAQGAYWRGGGWPPQWRMVSRALRDNGFPKEAAELDQLHLAAQSTASELYRKGYTPPALIEHLKQKWPPDGIPPGGNLESKEERTHEESRHFLAMIRSSPRTGEAEDTVFEFHGVQQEPGGVETPTFGQEIIGKGRVGMLHETRGGRPSPDQGFGGWGVVVPLSINRSMLHDAVHAFQGTARQLDQWVYTSLRNPTFSARHHLKDNPVLRPLADFLQAKPRATLQDFTNFLQRLLSPGMKAQLNLLRRGYIELKPVFHPEEGQTALRHFIYDGVSYDMKLDHLAGGETRVTVVSPRPIRMQFTQGWRNPGQPDAFQGSSQIFEIGGSQPVVTLRNGVVLPP